MQQCYTALPGLVYAASGTLSPLRRDARAIKQPLDLALLYSHNKTPLLFLMEHMQNSPVTAEEGGDHLLQMTYSSPRRGRMSITRGSAASLAALLPLTTLEATFASGRELPAFPLPRSGPGRLNTSSSALSPGATAWCAGLF